MAAGDTIPGKVRVEVETAAGNKKVVAGPYSSAQADQLTSPENRIHHNTGVTTKVQAPANAPVFNLPKADRYYGAGEVIRLQHKSASLAEAIDYDADEYQIGILRQDLNRGTVTPDTLTAADTELTSNPTSSTSSWVTFFEETVPDRQIIMLAGGFHAAAVENA